jgi:hypothetical protein
MKSSDRLKLPSLDREPAPPSAQTLDQIDQWIEQDHDLFFDRESYQRSKLLLSVEQEFVLRESPIRRP